MKDSKQTDRPATGAERREGVPQAQPWHAADEKVPSAQRGAPVGTHSLTGGSGNVGIPDAPRARDGAERSTPRDEPPGAEEPDPMAEPRANIGEILGRKP